MNGSSGFHFKGVFNQNNQTVYRIFLKDNQNKRLDKFLTESIIRFFSKIAYSNETLESRVESDLIMIVS